MMRKDLLEIIRYIKSKDIDVGVITNGWIHRRQIFEELDFVVVSVDGMEETHDSLRNMDGSWKRAVDLIFELTQVMKKSTSINFVVQRENYEQIPTVCDFFQLLGVPINFLCYNIRGMGQPSSEDARKIERRKLEKIINEICSQYEYAKNRSCTCGTF
ncbi:MAG: radical SAM protein [Nitrososphaerales archaeon]